MNLVQTPSFLFPRDVLSPTSPDAHFADEAEAARALGFTIRLIDHDAVVAGDLDEGLRGIAGSGATAIYRGWMITPVRYLAMERGLAERGVALRTSGDAFRRAHYLPCWFEALRDSTPFSTWTTSAELGDFENALARLPPGSAVIKDYSKSEKHYWEEAMFIPDVSDVDHARSVAARFLELRGDYFDTGFVVRQFEDLGRIESRSWWVNGNCVTVTAHPDTPDEHLTDVDVHTLQLPIASLELPFVSVDLARSGDTGALRIVEVGDGQVSDRPSSTDSSAFIAAIAKA